MTRVAGSRLQPCREKTCDTEGPEEGKLHVRFCGGLGRAIAESTWTLGRRVVSGRIRNTGSTVFTKVDVAIEWSDDKGTVLDSASKRVLYETLRAGSARQFSLDVEDSPRFSSYNLYVVSFVAEADSETGTFTTTEARDAGGAIVPDVVFEDLRQETDLFGRRVVSGRIRNTGSGVFTKIKVAIEWSDDKGTVLESGSETVLYDDLRAGTARSFSVAVKDNSRFSSFELCVVETRIE